MCYPRKTKAFILFLFIYLNRLPLCWFIFALGATPSTAMKKTFLGLII
jgi:hypothetical protein